MTIKRRYVLALPGAVLGAGALAACSDDSGSGGGGDSASEVEVFTWWAQGSEKAGLDALVAQARAMGFARLSLETGAQNSFRAARGLYAGAGFVECDPFDGYKPDPNSLFMSRRI